MNAYGGPRVRGSSTTTTSQGARGGIEMHPSVQEDAWRQELIPDDSATGKQPNKPNTDSPALVWGRRRSMIAFL
jgi:hypothetical protein